MSLSFCPSPKQAKKTPQQMPEGLEFLKIVTSESMATESILAKRGVTHHTVSSTGRGAVPKVWESHKARRSAIGT
jgi:TusA-related sulfurtransferase